MYRFYQEKLNVLLKEKPTSLSCFIEPFFLAGRKKVAEDLAVFLSI